MIISDSSTLILIAKISLLGRYIEKYGTLIITDAISEETKLKNSFENLIIQKELEKGNIKTAKISEKEYSCYMKEFGIAAGEASVLALSKRRENCLILTDDKKLINLCRVEQKKFSVSMAIVVKMYEEKVINKKTAFEKLDKLYGYGRYSKDLYDYFRGEVN